MWATLRWRGCCSVGVMQSTSNTRRALAFAVILALGVTASACGGVAAERESENPPSPPTPGAASAPPTSAPAIDATVHTIRVGTMYWGGPRNSCNGASDLLEYDRRTQRLSRLRCEDRSTAWVQQLSAVEAAALEIEITSLRALPPTPPDACLFDGGDYLLDAVSPTKTSLFSQRDINCLGRTRIPELPEFLSELAKFSP
jgi:hypothetical protein